MNAQRRKQIGEAIEKLDDLKGQIETLRDEERDFYDTMPESMQGGDKGSKAEESASALEEAADAIDTAISSLSTASE